MHITIGGLTYYMGGPPFPVWAVPGLRWVNAFCYTPELCPYRVCGTPGSFIPGPDHDSWSGPSPGDCDVQPKYGRGSGELSGRCCGSVVVDTWPQTPETDMDTVLPEPPAPKKVPLGSIPVGGRFLDEDGDEAVALPFGSRCIDSGRGVTGYYPKLHRLCVLPLDTPVTPCS